MHFSNVIIILIIYHLRLIMNIFVTSLLKYCFQLILAADLQLLLLFLLGFQVIFIFRSCNKILELSVCYI